MKFSYLHVHFNVNFPKNVLELKTEKLNKHTVLKRVLRKFEFHFHTAWKSSSSSMVVVQIPFLCCCFCYCCCCCWWCCCYCYLVDISMHRMACRIRYGWCKSYGFLIFHADPFFYPNSRFLLIRSILVWLRFFTHFTPSPSISAFVLFFFFCFHVFFRSVWG